MLDPISKDALIPVFGFSDSYYLHESFYGSNDVYTNPAYVALTPLDDDWTRVTLDLTSLGGTATNASVVFDLVSMDSSYDSQILIDNVSVAVVPAFSSVTLGVLGLGTLGVLRRRRRAGHE